MAEATAAAACLEALALEQGTALVGDPRLLEMRLRAGAATDAAGVELLLAAADAGVPEALGAAGADAAAIAARFAAARLVAPADAERAVAVWSTALRRSTATAAPAASPTRPRVSIADRLRRPIVLLPVTVAALSLLAAVVLPSPSADPVAPPAGGGLGGGRPTTSTAAPTTSTAGTGTGTAQPGTDGQPGPGGDPGPGDQPADPEAELRAMFPTLSSGCTRKTENTYGIVHLECTSADVNTWLIRFESAEAAARFFEGGVTDHQMTATEWRDDASGTDGFFALRSVPDDLIYWDYASPENAASVVVEAAGRPGFDLAAWWISVRTPVTAP